MSINPQPVGKNNKVILLWVKLHKGITGNKKADCFARKYLFANFEMAKTILWRTQYNYTNILKTFFKYFKIIY